MPNNPITEPNYFSDLSKEVMIKNSRMDNLVKNGYHAVPVETPQGKKWLIEGHFGNDGKGNNIYGGKVECNNSLGALGFGAEYNHNTNDTIKGYLTLAPNSHNQKNYKSKTIPKNGKGGKK